MQSKAIVGDCVKLGANVVILDVSRPLLNVREAFDRFRVCLEGRGVQNRTKPIDRTKPNRTEGDTEPN